MELAAVVISCVSALFTGWGLWYSRGLKRAADRSAQAAEESASAARDTADIDMARRADELAEAERTRVVWSLALVGKDRYRLTNEGTEPAYGVEIDTNPVTPHGETSLDVFPAAHAESYLIPQTLGENTDRMTVTWHHQPDRSDEPRSKELPVD